MANQQKWTLFSEKMPPENFGKHVIGPDGEDTIAYDIWITTKDYKVYPCRLYYDEHNYFIDGYFNEECEALAWMPLIGPEPYKD